MQLIEPLHKKKPDRQSRLRAYLALYGIEVRELAQRMNVGPSMASMILKGDCAPRHRVEQLIAMGIPRKLLPDPYDGKPGPKSKPLEAAA